MKKKQKKAQKKKKIKSMKPFKRHLASWNFVRLVSRHFSGAVEMDKLDYLKYMKQSGFFKEEEKKEKAKI